MRSPSFRSYKCRDTLSDAELAFNMIVLPLLQFAAIAIMFRQTNVVWAIFLTCVGILDILKLPMDSNIVVQKELLYTSPSDEALRMPSTDSKDVQNLRRRRAAGKSDSDSINPVQQKGSSISEVQGSLSFYIVVCG